MRLPKRPTRWQDWLGIAALAAVAAVVVVYLPRAMNRAADGQQRRDMLSKQLQDPASHDHQTRAAWAGRERAGRSRTTREVGKGIPVSVTPPSTRATSSK